MAKWDLQQEADTLVGGKRKQFSVALREYMVPLEQFVLDNLHDTAERDQVLLHLQTALLFAEECAKRYSIK